MRTDRRRSQPLQLVVDPLRDAAEIARFEAAVVRGPGAGDCWIFTGAIGGDGYGRNSAELHPMPLTAGSR